MIVYFVGLLALASVLPCAQSDLLHLPDHRVLPRLGAAAVAVVRSPASSRRRSSSTRSSRASRRPTRSGGSSSARDHRHPDARDRVRRRSSARRWPSRASSGARRSPRLEAALEENAGLHAQLLAQAREAGVLDERQRMAREIHDTIAQGLTGVVTQLEAAEQAPGPAGRQRQRHVENARGLARESLSEARRSVEALPARAARDGAACPTRSPTSRSSGRTLNGVPVEVDHDRRRPAAPPRGRGRRCCGPRRRRWPTSPSHASASRAGLTLSYMGDVVTLDVRDDGVGFDVPDGRPGDRAGFGLDGDAAAREPGRRHAGDRVRARRRDGRLGAGPGDRGARTGRPVP